MTTAAAVAAPPSEFRTGLTNAKLGVWLFLASEVMLFATLFTSYIVLRLGASEWPRGWEVLNVPLGFTNTLVLIVSSVTMVMAYAKCWDRDYKGFRIYLGVTIALGFVFLGIKSFEWAAKFRVHHFPSTSIYYALYFTMTGLHGLHVICGMIVNGALFVLSKKEWDHPLFMGRIEGSGLFWHFVDIVWIFLFPTFYLL